MGPHKAQIKEWRTPNQLFFVACCQKCGEVASSAIDGGVAITALMKQHDFRFEKEKDLITKIQETMDKGGLIEAIKHARREINLGLREARDYIYDLLNQGKIRRP